MESSKESHVAQIYYILYAPQSNCSTFGRHVYQLQGAGISGFVWFVCAIRMICFLNLDAGTLSRTDHCCIGSTAANISKETWGKMHSIPIPVGRATQLMCNGSVNQEAEWPKAKTPIQRGIAEPRPGFRSSLTLGASRYIMKIIIYAELTTNTVSNYTQLLRSVSSEVALILNRWYCGHSLAVRCNRI